MRTRQHLFQATLSLGVALYCFAAGAPVAAAADLPVACGAGSCGASGPAVWVTSGAATQRGNVPGSTRLDVDQTTEQVVLNWSEFNIAPGNTVQFNQPAKTSLAINRIFQNDPSKIFGSLTANGQIYLINQNGMLFGAGSKVNVNSMIASSLDMDPDAITGGILNPNLLLTGRPAFRGDGRVFVLDENGQVVTGDDGQPIPVKVAVADGAEIRSDAGGGGRIALFGQDVENAGTIESPAGQVLIAAGQKIYVQANNELRGLVVEVDTGGKAWNQATGDISAPLGNATLVGLAVNQEGRVSATTSVRQNGTVRLIARDTATVTVGAGGAVTLGATNAGQVTLAGNSVVEVNPDASDDETLLGEQQDDFKASRVEVQGRQIEMQAGSTIRAASGEVTLTALRNPNEPQGNPVTGPLPEDAGSRIRLAAGSVIDVSGSTATASVTRNQVEVELRANELRDSPLQRDGALRGATVTVDAREGTPVADVSGAVDVAIARDVLELTARGGTVSLASQGDIVLATGSTVDVSGGEIVFAGGVVDPSRLVTADGRSVDISVADPNRVYQGVTGGTYVRETNVAGRGVIREEIRTPGIALFDPGYVQGLDAGTVSLAGRRLVANGDLLGSAVNGPFQRTPGERALGGQLVIGVGPDDDRQLLSPPDFNAPSVNFVQQPVPVDVEPDQPLPDTWTRLELPTSFLTGGGFTRLSVFSNGKVSLGPGIDLAVAPGGSVALTGAVVEVNGSIRAPGGSVALTGATVNPGVLLVPGERPGVRLGDAVRIDTSGLWTNDLPAIAGPDPVDAVYVDGGSIDLRVTAADGELSLGDDVALVADAGAQLRADASVRKGEGGNVSLRATGLNAALATGRDLMLSALGLDRGGSLTIGAAQLRIGAAGEPFSSPQRNDPADGAATTPFEIAAGLLQQGGFQAYRFSATGGRLTGTGGEVIEPLSVLAGAELAPRQQLRVLGPGAAAAASGTPVSSISSVFVPTDDVRAPVNLALDYAPNSLVSQATAGELLVGTGSRILGDTGARIDLGAPTRIRIEGEISAPAGKIVASLRNPSGLLEQGFDPEAGIFVGSGARLLATGTTVLFPNGEGFRPGTVLDGGLIELNASRGTVQFAAGSVADVSGTRGELDVRTGQSAILPEAAVYRRETVASRGGQLSIVAPEGWALDGQLKGASGANGGAGPEGGTLSLALSRRLGFSAPADFIGLFPTGPRQIWLTAEPAPAAGDPNGIARFDLARVAPGGFDNLTLRADNDPGTSAAPDDAIVFAGDTTFAVANSLRLHAPNIIALPGVSAVDLTANYLALGPTVQNPPSAGTASSGTGTLVARAGLIDVSGGVALQGLASTRLESGTDIRLTGLATSAGQGLTGSLAAAGQLVLQASSLYPTTFSRFAISVAPEAGGRLDIRSNGVAPSPALSGAARLSLSAADVNISGVVRAPLGEIAVTGTNSIVVADGGILSTSGAGQPVLFGQVSGGTQWFYDTSTEFFDTILAPPEKRVTLDADFVTLADGSIVDVSGGGDLLGYEFVPGPGGSVDALSISANPNLFAVLPSGAAFAAFDTQESRGFQPRPGDSVYLEGVPGLIAAGTYALLPARYALLPGAVLVEAVAGTTDLPGGQGAELPDGTPVVSGYRTVAGTGFRDARTTGFAVRPGSYAQQLAEYKLNSANQFFAAAAARQDLPAPRLPQDAGSLRLLVGEQLRLDGTLRGAAVAGGRGAQLDVSATQLRVVANAQGAAPGTVEVEALDLESFGADSVLLGGTRESSSQGTVLTPVTSSVTIEDGLTLELPELLLTARDEVGIGAGTVLRATGAATGTAGGRITVGGSGGGALVRASRNGQVAVDRGDAAPATGNVFIGTGAVLEAAGSLAVDAAGTARSFGAFNIGSGALSLSSDRLVLGASQSDVADGLALDNTTLALLTGAGELRLGAGSEVAVRGQFALGSPAARPARLIIDAPLISSTGAAGEVSAGQLVLTNSRAPGAAAAVTGTGTLALRADDLVFDSGELALTGFASAELAGARGVRTTGEFTLRSAADLVISAPLLTGAGGSELQVRAPGRRVEFRREGTAAATTAGLGAALDVEAREILASTSFELPAGLLRLAAEDDVTVADGALIDLRGSRRALGSAATVLGAGAAQFVARSGSVVLEQGSRIDVSANDDRGEAGTIAIYAGDEALTGGDLLGAGPEVDRSGSLHYYAGTGDFASLNARLLAGGFQRRISFETAAGDVVIDPGQVVRAGEVTLAASGGSLVVNGTVDAATAGGGRITLAARDDLTVGSAATLDAGNTGPGGSGGLVGLMASAGQISLDSGATVDVSGPGGAALGKLLLRASADGADIRVATLGAALAGVAELVVEPVIRAQASDGIIDATDIAAFGTLVADYMAAAADTIRGRLGLDADRDVIRPGLEVSSTGDLTLASDWDFSSWRYDGQPGVLTIRAPGDLRLSGDLNDGLLTGGTPLAPTLTQLDGPSWGYRLAGGADLASALPLATFGRQVDARDAGSVRLDNNTLVRTGTGDIGVAAASDLILGGASSLIYTVGVPGKPSSTIGTAAARRTRYWMRDGGAISLAAGRDILATPSGQLLSGWNIRNRGAAGGAEWSVDLTRFSQGVATLGGGDIDVQAGRDIRNLYVTAVTTSGERAAEPGVFDVWGGGRLDVGAGRDLLSGLYSSWKGGGNLNAGRSIGLGNTANAFPVHTLLSFGEGSFALTARKDLTLEGMLNPTTVTPLANNVQQVSFFTYAPTDSLLLRAAGGNLSLLNNAAAFGQVSGSGTSFGIYPASVRGYAPSGSVRMTGRMRMLPDSAGQLEVAAGRGFDATDASVIMSDSLPASLATATNPSGSVVQAITVVERFAGDAIHRGDAAPVRLVAADGDFTGGTFLLAKHFNVNASRDLVDFSVIGQNTSALQSSTVRAGRDIRQTGNTQFIQLGGPGRLQLLAGRNVDLGRSAGVTTLGRTLNPNLAGPSGAAVDLWAGIGATDPDYEQFASDYLGPAVDSYERNVADRLAVEDAVLGYVDEINTRRAEEREQQAALGEDGPDPVSAAELADPISLFGELTGAEQRAVLDAEVPGWDVVLAGVLPAEAGPIDILVQESGASEPTVVTLGSYATDFAPLPSLYVRRYLEDAVAAVDSLVATVGAVTGEAGASPGQALETFLSDPRFSADEQRPLVEQLYFAELSGAAFDGLQLGLPDTFADLFTAREDGAQVTVAGVTGTILADSVLRDPRYFRGNAAIGDLFTSAGSAGGDLSLAFSRVYTLDGGDINMLVPGGFLDVGLATAPRGQQPKQPSELGIVAQGAGKVSIFAERDILVNQSRVFTLAGGDILVWSDQGDVDAGRGAKSAISAPAPTVTVTPDGRIIVEVAGAVAGSGVRGICTVDPEACAGQVTELAAPQGTINLGDAGVGGETVRLAALVIGNSDNAGGNVQSSAPALQGGALGAGLSGLASVSTSNSAADAMAANQDDSAEASLADSALGWLEVFIEGFGDGDGEEDEDEEKAQ